MVCFFKFAGERPSVCFCRALWLLGRERGAVWVFFFVDGGAAFGVSFEWCLVISQGAAFCLFSLVRCCGCWAGEGGGWH